jgi:purine-binding chemotaxis protein CheW
MTFVQDRSRSTSPLNSLSNSLSPSRTAPHMGSRAAASRSVAVSAGEFLTFRLGGEEYGVDILKVQEIRSYEAPTRIANSPDFLKGVVNLRGVIVPILDLRLKLGCERAELNAMTVVIVLNMRDRIVGAVVDSVSDVIQLDAAVVQPAPPMNAMVDTRFIRGIANVGERMLILVDIEAILTGEDVAAMDATF